MADSQTPDGAGRRRWFLLASAVVAALALLQWLVGLPPALDLARKLLSIVWLGALGALGVQGLLRARRRFLWRVRRKLVLSYVFLGFVPLVLVLAFALTGGALLYTTVAQYMFQEALSDVSADLKRIAEETTIEIGEGRPPGDVLTAKRRSVQGRYPSLRLETFASSPPSIDGSMFPAWLTTARSFASIAAYRSPGVAGRTYLLVRAVAITADRRRVVFADVPVDDHLTGELAARAGSRILAVSPAGCVTGQQQEDTEMSRSVGALFSETIAYVDCVDWSNGQAGTVSVKLRAPIGALSTRLAAVGSPLAVDRDGTRWNEFLRLFVLLAGLFFVVQGAAVVMGWLLVRSITSAIHELFIGTERVQQGAFGHRINIASRDQLGDLAESFNRMSGSIEHLLHVQREKQRLDDELRIARDIQRSLLPLQPPDMPGLDIADLCEPAREVGGDYYDFFVVGPRQLGILIADVSGKGTSAALYMAELKGLMLALSHTERSPRRLLIDVNRRLAEHLDNRSFITMTYAIVDLDTSSVTLARAGHTPAIHVRGDDHEILAPDGMVLGLRLPGASERFEDLLKEDTRSLEAGDVLVLYTDGITEAMDSNGDLFGDAGLVRVIRQNREQAAAELRDEVTRQVRAFAGTAEPHDDMTMIVVKVETRTGGAV